MAYKWMPVVLRDRCTGCRLCLDACGPKSLTMEEGVAVLAFPESCGSEEHCISVCAIHMAWVPHSGDRAAGKWQVHPAGIRLGMPYSPSNQRSSVSRCQCVRSGVSCLKSN